jgi:hypothetical protein
MGRPETFFRRADRSDGTSVAGKGDPSRALLVVTLRHGGGLLLLLRIPSLFGFQPIED